MPQATVPSPVSPPSSHRSPSSSSSSSSKPASFDHFSLAPPSPPQIDELEPSPVYSPISTPSSTPKPPPSPPLAGCSSGEASYREKEKDNVKGKSKEKEKEKPSPTTTTTPPDTGGRSPSPTNADSIALRSTLRLLMLQKERAKRDIVVLEEMREQALKDPVAFVEFVQRQKRERAAGRKGDFDKTESTAKHNPFYNKEIPKPQELYRCPPIEWSQYGILGAPLDHIHERQVRRPSPSRPAAASGVPQSMQTGGIIGMRPAGGMEFKDSLSGDALSIQGSLSIFETMAPRGSVIGR